ncbi:protein ASPARTIC PROTEASE IN GUARD CELL 1-like [Panicum virgatum]|uniref:protein ASPARTIC PROTEASE IN GUARD CELL 1-like n=1 Tax=Panicum virgatum TaxID=38727 RepID=UPI0019D595FA|nr:protein ASPARTIC PROTEASE IN GUARD CELL 1-like [Panicum virgatum]
MREPRPPCSPRRPSSARQPPTTRARADLHRRPLSWACAPPPVRRRGPCVAESSRRRPEPRVGGCRDPAGRLAGADGWGPAAVARPPRVSGGEATVIVDTASELTWVQCVPCDSCHDQQEPLFDPSSSPSYAAVPCDSPSCDAL